MPKVSVVIPAYNAMTYLPETMESVQRQTFSDFEVLIINDGSADNIVEWVSQLVDPRVKLICQTNQGVPLARNKGIANAQGEYIAFLDADDLWEPTMLEKQVGCLENNPTVGLVHTWMAVIDAQSQPTGRVMISNAEGDVWKQLVVQNTVPSSSVMVRRGCFDTVGGFDPNLRNIDDWDMWIRIAARYPFAVIKEPLMHYRMHLNNMTKNWQVVEEAFEMIIEKAFRSAPPELLYLKSRSYGHANMFLAWKAVQSGNRNYKKAIHFQEQAIAHFPLLRFSREYFRLSLAIAMLQWFGSNAYTKILSLLYALRRRILSLT
ncbi:glycosyltransferase family 2 protein [Brasilonema octagenarum UFV-E1]|uniref:Glycosyltransferase family 2 protein n=1 Tax=Brasilonema sennae CENA114 TaxID=415709 RepID=A0A856MG71_9CYAN|nr:glycosyltransferase family A protein [Brasilonema sennae]QDL09642.1 glycosyltransferase family 2 protein [Brasilonema sennae CENA114]QDL15996.1 glycosyltransferase family 2 protein [Brasilonema octagenarum UFV-E1]